eukprot:Gregarina_sp_Poly_1__183@NODE_1042_length_5264_cov_405_129690_g722_i0_p1_GENE_NODE_1042_length_5264_cov_405_129690_g722_i0NODE_1042_length_5264_cov_405_129690_g722_i0_p1_ORF_typecomplete_len734_score80_68H_PPase/PF03030_16/1_5e253PgaD/PF13994_6/0_13PgaD/PF13994_6/1_9e03PgaD/PF13994_6/6_2e03PTP_tm/PF18861_1/6_3e02PTP_tm/PF18861_1/1_7_NODE_1042_length_5264_cov_405_129690_g722_i01392340
MDGILSSFRQSGLTNAVLLTCPVVGLIWAGYESCRVSSVKLTGHTATSKQLDQPLIHHDASMSPQQLSTMKRISHLIADGAKTFLVQEYKWMTAYIVLFSMIIGPSIGYATMFAFILGALTSIGCGWIGMMIATHANVRTAHEAFNSLETAFEVAISAGSVMGLCLVSLGVLNLCVLIWLYRSDSIFGQDTKSMFEAIAGYGLGGSSIALFGRVGGGIFTKAADVGADLSGKNEYGMAEDDVRNPACIADNVGDNVGDVAGMGADLFGSLAESTCAALVIAGTSVGVHGLAHTWGGLMFPLMLSSTSIIVAIITLILIRNFYPVTSIELIETALKNTLVVSTALETLLVPVLAYYLLPADFYLTGYGDATRGGATASVILGLWSGLIIGYVTEYYTSHSYVPVREISHTQMVSAATGVIYGLALGYLSCIVPVVCIGVTVCIAHTICGMYGIALAALGMLGTLVIGLTIDAYGPISDNAGGIAEMAGLGEEVRRKTDALDAAGNTTAAIGKGLAIGSAALVSLALFGAYTVRAGIEKVDILDPWVFTGLLYGAMMPYAFSAMTMKSVGVAAGDMVKECLDQFPRIINGDAEPDYTRCISISTTAALREMVAPGALVILSPLLAGVCFGKNCTAGLLAGALVSGIQVAISASNSGGAWDNAKKYIESGALGPDHCKGSSTHKNAVTGDTIGDPLKDTSGPSLNILVKLSAIISLVFGTLLATKFSNAKGGPVWL